MSYKYNFKDTDFVKVDAEKFKAALVKKDFSQTAICEQVGVCASTINHAAARGTMKYSTLKKLCKVINMKPATFITSDKPVNNHRNQWTIMAEKRKEEKKTEEKVPVKKPTTHKTSKKAVDKLSNPVAIDKPLVVSLEKVDPVETKDNAEQIKLLKALVKTQEEIRDALVALVNELKYEPPKKQPVEKPKAYLSTSTITNKEIENKKPCIVEVK